MLQNKEKYKEITQLIARDENTPELAQFWSKKYFDVLENELLVLADRSFSLGDINRSDISIPSGTIMLCNHLNKEKRLNEDALIHTIETSVRLLDAMITYNSKQKNISEMIKKRVISLDLGDVGDFLEQQNPEDNSEDMEYLAQLVGETAYRASEFLAEEKGAFVDYDDIKYDVNDRHFDTWVDSDDNIKSNQEILSHMSDVQEGKYELLPRRNYAILDFSSEPKWKKYSDEDIIMSEKQGHVNYDKPTELAKPFNIRVSPQLSENQPPATPKSRVTNHVDEIFERLLHERKEEKVVQVEKQKISYQEPNIEPPKTPKIVETVIENAKDIRLYVLIEHNQKIVFAKHNNRLSLPFVILEDDSKLEQSLREGVLKKYNLLINLDREFTVLYDPLKEKTLLNIGFLADLQNHILPPDLFWAAPENEDFIDDTSFKILTKYKEKVVPKQKVTVEIPAKTVLETEVDKAIQSIVNVPKDKIEQQSPPLAKKPEVSDGHVFKKENQTKLLYSLRLDLKVQTKTFGNVYITFEYTKNFPQIASFRCDIMNQSDKHSLDIITNLVNLLLVNGYNVNSIESYLEEKVKKDESSNINNFITVFLFAMREVPQSVSEIKTLLG